MRSWTPRSGRSSTPLWTKRRPATEQSPFLAGRSVTRRRYMPPVSLGRANSVAGGRGACPGQRPLPAEQDLRGRWPPAKQVLGRLWLRAAASLWPGTKLPRACNPPCGPAGLVCWGRRGYGPADDKFRCRIREWLTDNLTGRFAVLLGAGGPGGTTSLASSGWPGTGAFAAVCYDLPQPTPLAVCSVPMATG